MKENHRIIKWQKGTPRKDGVYLVSSNFGVHQSLFDDGCWKTLNGILDDLDTELGGDDDLCISKWCRMPKP